MDQNVFLQFALILGLSCSLGYVLYKLKLPLVIAYLLVGVLVSILPFGGLSNSVVLEFLPELGIAFLLFLIGMELDFREIRSLGKPIVVASLGQIIISTLAGYAIAGYLGFNTSQSLLMGLGLSFSSTIVVLKLLLEKKDLSSLYGKLSIGILLIEDLVAIAVLMGISVSGSFLQLGFQNQMPMLALLIKIILLFFATFILSRFVLEKVFSAVAKSTELLFLTSLAWCFVFTSLALFAGFSIVIGAFLAGLALASSPYHFQIQSRIKPLRDFFVVLFFVYLGSQVNLLDALHYYPAVIIFTLYTIVIKPIIFLLILGSFGFRKHTMFQTAINLSQISEFSLVVLLVGANHATENAPLSIIATVAVLSITISSILITYARSLYKFFAPFIGFFEHSSKVHFLESRQLKSVAGHVVVIGAHRVGRPVVNFLHREKIPLLVIELNPHVVQEMTQQGINAIYGDASDPEILDIANLKSAKLVISTAQDSTDNEALLHEVKRVHSAAFVVARCQDNEHAKLLKSLGADYVITPETVTGDFLVDKIKDRWLKKDLD